MVGSSALMYRKYKPIFSEDIDISKYQHRGMLGPVADQRWAGPHGRMISVAAVRSGSALTRLELETSLKM